MNNDKSNYIILTARLKFKIQVEISEVFYVIFKNAL